MATVLPRPEAAWAALWDKSGVYDLAHAMRKGRRVGHVWFRPLHSVSFRATGPIVLLNQDPWGCVDINFHDNLVSQLHTIEGDECRVDAKGGTISATIRFKQLRHHGNSTVRRSAASGNALKTAALFMRAPEKLGATDDPNITQAKAYQTKLTTSNNGRTMLSTYYQHNDAYSECFDYPKFVAYWQTIETNGKNTAYFANQTSNAAQNPNGPAVNADQDYDTHAIAMQTIVVATCSKLSHSDAGNAATQFKNVTNGPSQQPQTVNNVLNIVQTSPPVPRGPNATMLLTAPEPENRRQAAMRPDVQQAILEIEQEIDDVRHGIIPKEQTGVPIKTGFRAVLEPLTLTITGTIDKNGPNGGPSVTFTKVTGTAPQVDVDLGAFAGELHAQVDAALDRASFVKALLGQRVLSALNDQAFLGYVSRMMTLAMNESLGPVKA